MWPLTGRLQSRPGGKVNKKLSRSSWWGPACLSTRHGVSRQGWGSWGVGGRQPQTRGYQNPAQGGKGRLL